MGVTLAVFSAAGKCPFSNESLNNVASTGDISCEHSLYAQFGTVLMSVFLFFSVFMTRCASLPEILVKENVCSLGGLGSLGRIFLFAKFVLLRSYLSK